MPDNKKVKVKIEVVFDDYISFKTHLALVRDRVNMFLKNPTDRDLSAGSEETAWSSHSFSIEETEK